MVKIILGIVVSGVVLVAGAYCWLDYSLNRRHLTSVDKNAAEKMAAATELPILWLGPAYDSDGDGSADLELSSFSIHQTSALSPLGLPQYEMYVGYGRCLLPKWEGGCPLPLTIVFDPPCKFIGDPPRIEDVRGVEARDAGDSIYLLTRDYVIEIWSHSLSGGATRVAESLYGANKLAAGITRTTDLPPRPAGLCKNK